MRNISNSEVGSWLTCRNKYRYAFDLDLEPKRRSDPLTRGTIGHDALDVYYKTLKMRQSEPTESMATSMIHEYAMRRAVQRLGTVMAQPDAPLDLIMDVRRILELYWAYYEGDSNWEILEVESMHTLPLNDDYAMPTRLDLLVRDEQGKIALVDHKFFYDMPNPDKLALNVQFPKYIGALAEAGIKVDYCVLNVLRYRKLKNPALSDVFKRYKVTVSPAKIRRALATHILASQEIAEYRALPEAVRPSRAIPVFNDMICKHCDFSTLCQSEFDGGNIDYLIETDYQKNSYGYNDPTTEGLL